MSNLAEGHNRESLTMKRRSILLTLLSSITLLGCSLNADSDSRVPKPDSNPNAPECTYEWFVDLGQFEPCPDTVMQTAQATYQPFEHGFMIWRDGKIWAFYDSGGGISVIDSYNGGETLYYQDPPDGLYHPIRRIGKVWVDFELLRAAQGWATAPEEDYTMAFQSVSVNIDSPGGNVMQSSGTHLYTFTLPGNRVMTATITSTQISSWSRPVVR
jgi:hypothetical protein